MKDTEKREIYIIDQDAINANRLKLKPYQFFCIAKIK